MEIGRWRQIEQIYDSVLDAPPEWRSALLDEACSGDPDLRGEVESLLSASDEAQEFLSRQELKGHIGQLTTEPAVPVVGSTVGHYQVLSFLGAGAMGEVYLACDTSLDRQVALKLLPDRYTRDPERVTRFVREAKAASSLNHPNIITIYEIGQTGDTWFISAEYVPGGTLRDRMANGILPLSQAIEIVLECAEALAAAHRAGVVHRDIKPENIMVRPDGVAKVVDFGLARMAEARPERMEATQTGSVMGTPRYMSPEQARGQKPDARSDIFSLGAVLFEVATGRPAFPGTTIAEVFSALLNEQPDMADAGTLGGVLARAMVKEPEGRYQSMDEFAGSLRDCAAGRAGPVTERRSAAQLARPLSPARLRALRRRSYAALAAAVVLALGAGVYGLRLKTTTPMVNIHAPVPLTGMDGLEFWPEFSPDGKQIVYARDTGDGDNPDLYLKLIGGGPPLRLPARESGNMTPAWSPDGQQIAFIRRYSDYSGVFTMSVPGGAERLVGKISDSSKAERSLTWRPDQKALIVSDEVRPGASALWSLPLDGSPRRTLTSPPDNHGDVAPAFSRDGGTLAFIRSTGLSGELYLLEKPGRERRIATGRNIDSLAWSADGQSILFTTRDVLDRAIWRIRPDGSGLVRLAGSAASPFNITVAAQGERLAFAQRMPGTSDILKLDITGKNPPRKLIASAGFDTDPLFSPDGTRIAFASTRTGKSQIWVAASDGSNQHPVTSLDGLQSGSPRWSPDGSQLAFGHATRAGGAVFVMNADGGAPRELVSNAQLPAWSPHGRWIYFTSNRSKSEQIWKVPTGGGSPVQVTQNGGFECFPSPDGFLYYSRASVGAGIWRMPADGGPETEIPELRPVVRHRYWSGNSAGIYFLDPGRGSASAALKFYRFANRRVEQVLSPVPPPMGYIRGLAVSPDGHQVLWVQLSRRISQILLVEGFR